MWANKFIFENFEVQNWIHPIQATDTRCFLRFCLYLIYFRKPFCGIDKIDSCWCCCWLSKLFVVSSTRIKTNVNGLMGALTFMKVYSMVIEMWKYDIITIAHTLTAITSEDFRFCANRFYLAFLWKWIRMNVMWIGVCVCIRNVCMSLKLCTNFAHNWIYWSEQ